MKIICSKSELLNGVQIVSRAVAQKSTMSIMECVLIDATGDTITLTANNQEMGIKTTIEGEISESGKLALDAGLLLDIVRKFDENDVTVYWNPADETFKTSITCEKSSFTLMGRDGEEYSYMPDIERIDPITITQFSLKDAIRQTIFSISEDNNNKLMTGELFEINGNILRVISLDGHRISLRKVIMKNSYPLKKVVIPGKTLSEIAKILTGDADKEVTMYFTGKHAIFEFENVVVTSRLIEGEYFMVDTMMNSDYETKVKIVKNDFFKCIDRATLLIRDGVKDPIIINITDDKMELKLNSTIGSMNESVSITKQGKDIMIGFNPKFLLDALKIIEDEEIEIYLVSPKSPIFIKNNEETYNYMILPVNFIKVD